MADRGLFGNIEDTVMSPLFLGGAALLSGEGMGGALQGMQAGSQFADRRRKQEQELQAQNALREGVYRSPALAGMTMGEREMLAANPQMAQSIFGTMFGHRFDPTAKLKADLMKAQIGQTNAETAMIPLKTEQLRAQTDMTNAHASLYRSEALNKEDPTQQFAIRARQAAAYGLTPDHPAYKPYILTGKMPREDQQPLTATDKKAIIEAEDDALKAAEARAKAQSALKLNPQTYVGPTAALRGYLSSLAGSADGLATGQFRDLVGELTLDSLKTTFGGNPTEGERAALMELQASVNKPAAQRKAALERVIGVLGRREQFERQRADQLRGGSYYKPGGGTSMAPAQTAQSQAAPTQHLDDARSAIQRGAPRDAVIQRLRQMGIDPMGL